jgi:preprotein translocase subunit SecF
VNTHARPGHEHQPGKESSTTVKGVGMGIDFMSRRYFAGVVSTVAILVSALWLGLVGLNFGLDFTGGTLVEVAYTKAISANEVRSGLSEAGYPNASVVHYGSEKELLIRLPKSEDIASGDRVTELLRSQSQGNSIVVRRIEFVGPQVGSDLREQGGLALLAALGLVMMYVAFRFQFKFAFSAVAALFHDVLIVFGVFAITGWSFDITVLAALLAVIGYSLNDTIVVSDRIRENFYGIEHGASARIVNISLNQTLGRTLITSLTTLLVLFSLLLLGGEQVRGFASALIVGVVVGTYSSIYVSSSLLLAMRLQKDDFVDEQAGQRTGGEL